MHVNRELNAYSEYCASTYSSLYEDNGQGARDTNELLTRSFTERIIESAKDANISRIRILMDYGIDINRMTFLEYLQMVEILMERHKEKNFDEE